MWWCLMEESARCFLGLTKLRDDNWEQQGGSGLQCTSRPARWGARRVIGQQGWCISPNSLDGSRRLSTVCSDRHAWLRELLQVSAIQVVPTFLSRPFI
jgi:hypothetical protein